MSTHSNGDESGSSSLVPRTPAPAKSESARKAPECTVGLICDAYEALSTLSSEKVDSKTAARMLKIAKWVEPIYEEYTDYRKEVLKKYGTPVDGSKDQFTVPGDKVSAFVDEINAEAKKPVTFPGRLKLTIAELDGAKISPAVLLRTRFFLLDLDLDE